MGDVEDSYVPDVGAVDALLRRGRRRRPTIRSFADWYSIALAVALVAAGLTSLIMFDPWDRIAGCTTALCSTRAEVSSLAMALAFGLIVHVGGLISGPISVAAAEAFWVFSSPIERRALLVRRKRALVLGTLLGGVGAGLLHCGVWNPNPWWLIAFPLVSVVAMGWAALVQGHSRSIRMASASAWAVAVIGATFLSGSEGVITGTVSAAVVPGTASALAVLAMLLGKQRAWGRSNTLGLSSLRRVQGARDAVAGAVSSADSGLLLDVAWARMLATRNHVTPFSLHTHGWRAVLEAEFRRCLRSPLLLGRVVLFCAVVALSHFLGVQGFLIGISLATMVFTSLGLAALRMHATSRGLARSFPQSTVTMRMVLVAPTAVMIVALILLALGVDVLAPGPRSLLTSGPVVLAAATAGLAGGIRWASAPPTQFSAGIVMTEMGPIHVSAWMNSIRGADAAVLLALPAVVGLHPLLSLAVPVGGLLWVLLRT